MGIVPINICQKCVSNWLDLAYYMLNIICFNVIYKFALYQICQIYPGQIFFMELTFPKIEIIQFYLGKIRSNKKYLARDNQLSGQYLAGWQANFISIDTTFNRPTSYCRKRNTASIV